MTQLGEDGDLREVALLWARLAAHPAAAGLRIHPVGEDRHALVVPDTVPPDQVAALTALARSSVRRRPAPTGAGLSPALIGALKGNVVRDAPSIRAPPRRYVPQSSLLVALYGDVRGRVSQPGTGSMSYVVTTRNDEGWFRARFARPYGACVPDLGQFARDVPGGRGEAAARDAIISPRTVRIHGHGTDGFMFTARDLERGQSYVGLYTRDAACGLTQVAMHVIPGIVEVTFLTSTGHRRGKTLLVASAHPGREPDPRFEETWTVYEMGQARALWARRLTSSLHLPPRERTEVWGPESRGPQREPGYWPLVVFRPGFGRESFVWDGRTLAPDTALGVGSVGTYYDPEGD